MLWIFFTPTRMERSVVTRTTPTPGVDGRFKDKNLPKRLGERELDKSYAPLTAIP